MKKIIRSIYKILPFKRTFLQLLKRIYTPSERIYKHLHFKGVVKVKVDNTHQFKIHHWGFQLENEIFWEGLQGGWEKVSIDIWVKLCKKSNVIIDIGANTGIFSLVAKSIQPNAKVYAFEPVKRVFEKLQQNITLNQFDIKSYELAVSNQLGKAIIYDTPTDHIYSVTVNKNLSEGNDSAFTVEIDLTTLDTFIEEEKLTGIDLMKIDVETHEPEVLEGFKKHIATFKPTMLIEILNNEVAEKVNLLVKDLEYLYFNIDEKSGIRKTETIEKSDYYNYLICDKATAQYLELL